jgi:hypothetical protein
MDHLHPPRPGIQIKEFYVGDLADSHIDEDAVIPEILSQQKKDD